MFATGYRQQLTGLVQALSMPNQQGQLGAALAAPSNELHVKMFVDGNLEKRLDKLCGQLAFVAEVLPDFEELAAEYIRSRPLAAFDTGAGDAENMLAWLAANHPLTPVQHDYVHCQRARHAVELLARENRAKYVRFQELHRMADELSKSLDSRDELCLHLNPIRVWSRFFTSELLDDASRPPVNVLFFAVAGEVATTVLELEGQALVNELADYEPCTLGQWTALSRLGDRRQLLEFSTDLATLGLVCFS